MIPKTIHYCWFGNGRKSRLAERCIASWRKFLPEYTICEWTEENFDVRTIPFTAEAYDAKKYAFVSDYARLKILYEYGGVYFDTDVEIIRPMDGMLFHGSWMGIEDHSFEPEAEDCVALGLGFAIEAHHPILKEIMDYYEHTHFSPTAGGTEQTTIVRVVSGILRCHGLPTVVHDPICVEGITILPADYLCPKNYITGRIRITPNTVCIHHFDDSWHSPLHFIMLRFTALVGDRFVQRLVSLKHFILNVIASPISILQNIRKISHDT